ncbi:MAG: ThiF family adenylyltransferase [Halobaculum sp.]
MTEPSLDATQLDRYSRQLIMDEIGPEGQAALRDASVLVVGAGGLGSPALQYLAAAGVGRITVADDDVVERSNLHRQVVHADGDVGRPKAVSAAESLRALNPDVTVEPHTDRVSPDIVRELVADHTVVVDGSDNFPTRYLLNDATRLADRPLVHGAVYKFEGQATTLAPDGPCYRCLFPDPPDPGTVPDCATTGVLGALPGVVGTVQATEVVKLLTDLGDPLVGRLFAYDATDVTTETVRYGRRPDCPACDRSLDLAAVRYDDGCGVSAD